MVNLLLDFKAKINLPSCRVCECEENWNLGDIYSHVSVPRWLPLHHAVCQGHIITANILLDRGASVQVSVERVAKEDVDDDDNGEDDDGKDKYKHDRYGPSLVHCASARGLESLVQRAIEMDPTILNCTTDESPFHYASETWNAEGVIRCLASAGADLEKITGYPQLTPMFRACEVGNFSTALHLLRAGAQTRPHLTSPGRTSSRAAAEPLLHLAVRSRDRFFMNTIPPPQETRNQEQIAFVRALIEEFGFDVNEPFDNGRGLCTPLLAALNGDDLDSNPYAIPGLIELLLNAGADPNYVGPGGNTPMLLAVCEFNYGGWRWRLVGEGDRRPEGDAWKVVSTLLRFGARLDLVNNTGHSALSIVGDLSMDDDDEGHIWRLFDFLKKNSWPKTLSSEHLYLVYDKIEGELERKLDQLGSPRDI